MAAIHHKNTYFRLLSYLRPYWQRVILLFVCTAIFAALSGVSLTMIPPFLHILFSEEQAETVSSDDGQEQPVMIPEALEHRIEGMMDRAKAFIYKGRPIDRLARFCVIFFALMLLKNLFDYLLMYITMYLEQSVLHRIRNELYSKIHTLPMSFFDSQKTGHLISRITNDVNRLKGTVVYSLTSIVKNVLLTIIAVAIIIYTSWKLSLLAVILVPLNTVLITVISRKLRKRSRRAQERMADMTSVLQETISGVRVVKAFGMEGFEKSKFRVFNRRYLGDYINMMKFGELASPLSEILGMMASVVLLWYGGGLVIAGELDPANLMLFIVAMLWVVSPVKHLSKLNSSVQEGLAAGERVFQIIDIADGAEISGRRRLEDIESGIEYEGVSFSYENGPEVLHDISISISKGEVVALVGPSGAGKSTIADLLPRFYNPSAGRITIDGTDIREFEISSLRSMMGIVTQETILFNDTVFNNIAYGMSDCDSRLVESAAAAANAAQFISEMPEGYDTVIGDRGVQLSGGQRQRLAIARALLKNPRILILDEATSSLDVESEALVQEAIERLVKGRTTLVIAHRLSTIKSADRIIVVEDGKIIQTGTHEELIGEEGTYKKLYHLQIRA